MKYIHMSFKNTFAYRSSVFIAILRSILSILINLLIWNFLYTNNNEMISYMTCYTILAHFVGFFYTNKISNLIGDKIMTGEFVTDLVKPINMVIMSWQIALGIIISNLLLRGVPVLCIFFPLLFRYHYYNMFHVVLSIILGHIINTLIYAIVGLMTFIILKIWPLQRIIDDTIRLFSGVFLPLAILPRWMVKIANFLPFKYLYSYPIQLLLSPMDQNIILYNYCCIIIWIIILVFLVFILYKNILKAVTVFGG